MIHGLPKLPTWTEPTLVCFPVSPKETAVIVDPAGPILEGSSVSLLCRSRSNPPVTNYTWYRGDEVDQEAGPVLSIDGADPSHSGEYHCTATNDLGEETSAAIQLDVQCEFTQHKKALIYSENTQQHSRLFVLNMSLL